jgi:hypothetical protein
VYDPPPSPTRAPALSFLTVGITCFINRQLIYNFPEQIFTENGVISIEHADFDGIERLAAVTGGEIASTFDRPEACHTKTLSQILHYVFLMSFNTIYLPSW